MSITYDARVVVPDGVLFREVGNESALVNLNKTRYFGLDEVGTSFWKALTSSASIEEAYDALLEEFDVEPGELRKELDRLVEELMDNELLEVAGQPS